MAVTCLGDTDIPYNETDYSQSPNISTLGQFGDIPVSQFTGVPKISIPICKIEINGKSIPITLDYHTSGIRMEQKPGWIGAGWSLMAAGAIVRLQNGGNDEYQHFMKKKNIIYGGQGYFQNLNDLNNDNWGTQSFLNDFIENYNSTYLSLNQDLDPDEFRFDFLGHSGSFFKDCQGQWQIRSKENFRIADMSLGKVPYEAPDNLGKPDVIVGFTLIGDDGIIYKFGYDIEATDFEIRYYEEKNQFWHSSAWNLTEIDFPDGAKIKYSYKRSNFTTQTTLNRTVSLIDGHEYPNPSYILGGALIAPSCLETITFPDGTVDFFSSYIDQPDDEIVRKNMDDITKQILKNKLPYSIEHYLYYLTSGLTQKIDGGYTPVVSNTPKNFVLDSIKVVNRKSEVVSRCVLIHHGSSNLKLGLDEVRLYGSNNQCQKYSFEYYKTDKLPNTYHSEMFDHWGYYRGQKYLTDIYDETVDRSSNPMLAGYGVLNKIIYPTGGYTRFEYEAHNCHASIENDLSYNNHGGQFLGGCRIKRIINNATNLPQREVVSKEYYYCSAVDYIDKKDKIPTSSAYSTGILAGIPKYELNDYVLNCPTKKKSKKTFGFKKTPRSVFAAGVGSSGNYIGYSEVIEKYPNGSFRVFKFSNHDNGYSDEAPTALYGGTAQERVPVSSLGYTRGLILQVDDYDQSFNLKKSRKMSYSTIDKEKYVRGIYTNVLHYDVDSKSRFYPYLEASSYKHFYDMPRLSKEEVTIYSGKLSNSRLCEYFYNKLGQISKTLETFNSRDMLETKYKYLWETSGMTNDDEDYVPSLISSKERTIINTFGTEVCLDYETYIYDKLSQNLFVPTRSYKVHFGDGTTRTTAQKFISQLNSNTLKTPPVIPSLTANVIDTTCADFDSKGHLLYYSINNTEPSVYLWGNQGQRIVAVIKGSSLNEVMHLTGMSKDELGNLGDDYDDLIDRLRALLPGALITSYKFKPLVGMTKETTPSVVSTYYDYDTRGRLKTIKNDRNQTVESYQYHTIR